MKIKDKEFIPVSDEDGVFELKLSDLFDKSYDELPKLVDSYDCIYMIRNIITDDCYIGQTKNFYGRFISNNWSHYHGYLAAQEGVGGYEIHQAIVKDGIHNFRAYVVERNIPIKERLLEEIHFIDYFDSYINGYNGTTGGDNCEQIQSDEAQELAAINSRTTKLINSISQRIITVKDLNYPINYYTYRMFSGSSDFIYQHLPKVLDHLEYLRKDSRWTSEMESIFKFYESGDIPPIKSLNCIIAAIDWRLKYLQDNNLDLTLHNYLIEIPIRKNNVNHVISVIDNLYYLKLDPRVTSKFLNLIEELNAPTWDEVYDKIYDIV